MQEHALAADAPREFAFTSADFQRIRKLIYDYAGIALVASKQEMVYSRLARRLRWYNLHTFAEYIALLGKSDESEWQAFVNALTTNLTSFFREAHHFKELAGFLAERRGRRDPLTIWCCAASTGEEPYSIAMTVIDTLGSLAPPVSIIATDLDTNVLARASAGIYDQERVEKLRPEDLRRFFIKGTGSLEGTVRVRPELRALVTFRPLNLLDTPWPLRGPFDAIFCRNVMIYFDKPTQRKVLQSLAPTLRPDGLLFAGHSECFLHSADLFHLRGKTVYELASPARQLAAVAPH